MTIEISAAPTGGGQALIPTHAIVLYDEARQSVYARRSSAVFATVHGMTVVDGVPQLGAGAAVAREGLMALFSGLDPQRNEMAKLTSTRVLTQGAQWMVWYSPASKRRVWFNASDVGQKSAEVPLPPLLFAVSPLGWHVFAMKTGRRPGASTQLYQAPFYNVWKDGKLCVGSTPKPQGDARWDPAAWEKAFFESNFTHSNVHGEPLVHYRGGAAAFWKALLRGKKFQTFPKEVLVERKLTVGQLLAQINGSLRHGA